MTTQTPKIHLTFLSSFNLIHPAYNYQPIKYNKLLHQHAVEKTLKMKPSDNREAKGLVLGSERFSYNAELKIYGAYVDEIAVF